MNEVCYQKRRIDYDSHVPECACIALTEFHILLLYTDRVIAISNINKEIVFVCQNDEVNLNNAVDAFIGCNRDANFLIYGLVNFS